VPHKRHIATHDAPQQSQHAHVHYSIPHRLLTNRIPHKPTNPSLPNTERTPVRPIGLAGYRTHHKSSQSHTSHLNQRIAQAPRSERTMHSPALRFTTLEQCFASTTRTHLHNTRTITQKADLNNRERTASTAIGTTATHPSGRTLPAAMCVTEQVTQTRAPDDFSNPADTHAKPESSAVFHPIHMHCAIPDSATQTKRLTNHRKSSHTRRPSPTNTPADEYKNPRRTPRRYLHNSLNSQTTPLTHCNSQTTPLAVA